jgi:hypothetical protein
MCKKEAKNKEIKAEQKQRMKWYTPRLMLRVFLVLQSVTVYTFNDSIDVGIPEPDFRLLIGLS